MEESLCHQKFMSKSYFCQLISHVNISHVQISPLSTPLTAQKDGLTPPLSIPLTASKDGLTPPVRSRGIGVALAKRLGGRLSERIPCPALAASLAFFSCSRKDSKSPSNSETAASTISTGRSTSSLMASIIQSLIFLVISFAIFEAAPSVSASTLSTTVLARRLATL